MILPISNDPPVIVPFKYNEILSFVSVPVFVNSIEFKPVFRVKYPAPDVISPTFTPPVINVGDPTKVLEITSIVTLYRLPSVPPEISPPGAAEII